MSSVITPMDHEASPQSRFVFLFRATLLVLGILNLILAAGYFFQLPWAIQTWPWPDGRLSYIFVASIIAAIAAALIWIAVTGELRPVAAGSLNLMVMLAGFAAYFFHLYQVEGQPRLLGYAVAAVSTALFNLILFFWTRRLPIHDPRPTPRPVLVSYVLFCLILVGVALALFRREVRAFPWHLDPSTSVLFAWVFLGDAFYFLYALLYPRWHNAAAQLWSFLVYDLVLIVPYLLLLGRIEQKHLISLIIYLGVLFYSGGLAAYYLFIHKQTRLGTSA